MLPSCPVPPKRMTTRTGAPRRHAVRSSMMKTFMQKLVGIRNAGLALALLGVGGPRTAACTAFQFNAGDRFYFAKNYDFMMGEGLLVVNRRGIGKQSVQVAQPIKWVSRYGSVTYNQFGRELPNGGMNQAGLVVEMLWLQETKYAPVDRRPEVGTLQWIQYQLDTAGTVAEVIASDRQVRVAEDPGRVHYFVSDRAGGAAVLELLNGKLQVYTGADLPIPVLANDAYAECVKVLRGGEPRRLEADQALSFGPASFDRFGAVAAQVGKFDPKRETPTAFALGTLQRVRHPQFTQWQVVYDLTQGRLYLRRQIDDVVREVDFAKCDFASSAVAMAADLTTAGPLQWVPCTTELNRRVIGKSYGKTPFLKHVGDAELDQIAAFPEAFRPVGALSALRKLD